MKLMSISLASTLLLTGCGTQGNSFISEAKEEGYNVSKIDDTMYDIVDSIYSIDGVSEEVDKCECPFSKQCTVSEFGRYTGESNITWNDIKETINNNSNINDNIKQILLGGISRLEGYNLKIKIEVLNYNLKNLKIEYVDYEDTNFINEGFFDAVNQTINISNKLINDSNFNKVILHEVLGHGMTVGYIKENGGILCAPSTNAIVRDDNCKFNETSPVELGCIIKEAEAEMIAIMASGEKALSDGTNYYSIFVEELSLILSSTNTSFSELVNNGINHLISNMKKGGCKKPVDYLFIFEVKKAAYEKNLDFCEYYGLLDNVQTEYLSEIVEKLKMNGKSNEYIDEFVNKCFLSSKQYIYTQDFDGDEGIFWYNASATEVINYDYIKSETMKSLNSEIKKISLTN